MECEHILSVLPGSGHWILFNKDFKNVDDKQLEELKKEYGWSHRVCNRVKSNFEFIKSEPIASMEGGSIKMIGGETPTPPSNAANVVEHAGEDTPEAEDKIAERQTAERQTAEHAAKVVAAAEEEALVKIDKNLTYVANEVVIDYVLKTVNDDYHSRQYKGYWRERDHLNSKGPLGIDRYLSLIHI